jgi:HlyD family secretion protein
VPAEYPAAGEDMRVPSEKIFRQIALERLSSPEQLDRLITLTSPAGWAALGAIAVLQAGIVGWGVFGSVPTRVEGAGILVTRGGMVFDAMAPAAGSLATMAAIGTSVHKGDVVATLDDVQARQDLEHARNVLYEQQQQLDQLSARFDREIAARRKVDEQQRENLSDMIRSAEQRHEFYSEQLKSDKTIVASGFITRRFVEETRQQMDTAEQEGQRARSDLLRIDAEELDESGRRDQEVWHQQGAVNAARRTVEELTIRLESNTRIVSPIAGHVTEAKASVGTVVAPGKPVLSIETAGQGLELVLYIPPEQGKKVAPEMEVRIEPATTKKEEFGTLIGRVLDISEFPISPEGMLAVLQNQQLATAFSARGAPFAARVGLVPDAANPSGYAWSAGRGPPVALSAGTTASAEVTVRTQAPVALVLPLLRQRTGIGG